MVCRWMYGLDVSVSKSIGVAGGHFDKVAQHIIMFDFDEA